jgi:hypothetical protein
MGKYKKVSMQSEAELEDLICADPSCIEEGFKMIDRQLNTVRGPLDILGLDSGRCLTVVELKINQEDGMLMQALDYFGWVNENRDSLKRMYPNHKIDFSQVPRVILVAPSFSELMRKRVDFIREDIQISMLAFEILEHKEEKIVATVPITSQGITGPPPQPKTLQDFIDYIQDTELRKSFKEMYGHIKNISEDTQDKNTLSYVGFRIAGKTFASLNPHRKDFSIYFIEDNSFS